MHKHLIIVLLIGACATNLLSQSLTIESKEITELLKKPDLNPDIKSYWNNTFKIDLDKKTFDFIDTLTHKNDKFFPLYFLTFNNLLSKSDGALSESMGPYCLNMITNYPKEAISNFQTDSTNLYLYSLFIGSELYFKDKGSSSIKMNYKEFKSFLVKHLNFYDNRTKSTFDAFFKKVDYFMKIQSQ